MKTMFQKLIAFLAAAWRAGEDLPLSTGAFCGSCGAWRGARRESSLTESIDDLVRERLATLTLPEAIAMARVTALRDGERELAAALQAVLLLHLTGGSLAPIAGMVRAEPAQETVN